MIIDAFLQLIAANLHLVIDAAIFAVVSIAAIIVGLVVFENSARKLLRLVSGDSGGPKVGYQYEEYVNGKPVYRTWTKKDRYLHDKARR
ncbi:MAG: hypothetical protein QE488_06915 [Acidovorax sp.]|nr:hypothetical protein [Acidovorax sp.]